MDLVDGRILIAGGGIAGLALAQALHRRGLQALVLDRLSAPPDAGLGLNLPGNAVRALSALATPDSIARLGTPIGRREYRNARGRLLFAVDEDAFWGAAARPTCVRRSDLLDLLGRGLPVGTVRWNSQVASVRPTPAGAEVVLVDGTIERAGLVVGADGVHSTVRTTALDPAGRTAQDGDPALRPSLLSAASWRFMAPNPGVGCWTVWSGAQGVIVLIPVDADEVYGYASATRGSPVGADPQWLPATFAHFSDPVPRVLATVLAHRASSLYHSPVEDVRIPCWSRGRVVLIGDAAHATGPVWAQGAALAVEDALVLAELLATTRDWGQVGREYERWRRPRVGHVQVMTDRFSRAAGLPSWVRDTVLRFAGPRGYRETYSPLRAPVVS